MEHLYPLIIYLIDPPFLNTTNPDPTIHDNSVSQSLLPARPCLNPLALESPVCGAVAKKTTRLAHHLVQEAQFPDGHSQISSGHNWVQGQGRPSRLAKLQDTAVAEDGAESMDPTCTTLLTTPPRSTARSWPFGVRETLFWRTSSIPCPTAEDPRFRLPAGGRCQPNTWDADYRPIQPACIKMCIMHDFGRLTSDESRHSAVRGLRALILAVRPRLGV